MLPITPQQIDSLIWEIVRGVVIHVFTLFLDEFELDIYLDDVDRYTTAIYEAILAPARHDLRRMSNTREAIWATTQVYYRARNAMHKRIRIDKAVQRDDLNASIQIWQDKHAHEWEPADA